MMPDFTTGGTGTMDKILKGGSATASEHAASFRSVVYQLTDYEPGRDVEEVAEEIGVPVASIVKLASNENPFGPSPKACERFRASSRTCTCTRGSGSPTSSRCWRPTMGSHPRTSSWVMGQSR